MTSSRDLSRASLPRDKAFLPYALRVHQLLMGETPKTALVHHLSRYTAATMYPRQLDARLEWCAPLFRTRSLDLTDNFFPPESLGTNVSKILSFLHTFGILPTKLLCRTPYSKLSRYGFVRSYSNLQLDFTYKGIVQPLKPLLCEDSLSKLSSSLSSRRGNRGTSRSQS